MKTISTSMHGLAKRQSGVALIVGLLILLVLIIVGVAASNLATQQERMARGSRDYNIALQAAEAALRDAKRDSRLDPASFTVLGCAAGLCLSEAGSDPVWEGNDVFTGDASDNSARYGQFTDAALFPRSPQSTEAVPAPAPAVVTTGGVALQPRYLIERLENPAGCSPDCEPPYIYRITARGYGSDPRTQVTLQEVYNP